MSMESCSDFSGDETEQLIFAKIRKQRIEEAGSKKSFLTEVALERDLLQATIKEPFLIAHFYDESFRRCSIMNAHLEHLSKEHPEVNFVKIKVQNAPFLTGKLLVKQLPCVIVFKGAHAVDRIVGFEELGNTDTFPTAALERRLDRRRIFESIKLR